MCDYNGGTIDVDAVLAARAGVIGENQRGGHHACRGCPHLVTRRWRAPRQAVRLIGIAQFAHCNIECNYCYLQTQDPSLFAAGFDPYPVLPALRQLAAEGRLAPDVVMDWGGGEPTIYREFDDVLEFATRFGATTWIHTNGTRLPPAVAGGLSTKRVHVICSVDAGTRETWKRIKNRDLLETVWRNLERYVRHGCRVVLKYIVKDENCDEPELDAFLHRAVAIGARELVIDIDYDDPVPSARVIAGIRHLRGAATMRGVFTTFGSTGAFYTPEVDVAGSIARGDRGPSRRRFRRFEFWLRDRLAYAARQARLCARTLRVR